MLSLSNKLRTAFSLILFFIPSVAFCELQWLKQIRDCEEFSIEIARYYNTLDESKVTQAERTEIDEILDTACGPKFKSCGFAVCENRAATKPAITPTEAKVEEREPEPTPTPLPTQPPLVTASPTVKSGSTPVKPTATTKPTITPKPATTVKPTVTPKSTVTPRHTVTISPTSQPKGKQTNLPTPTKTTKPTNSPKPENTKVPAPALPTPTQTAKGTNTSKPEQTQAKPQTTVAPTLPTVAQTSTAKPGAAAKSGGKWYEANIACGDFLKELRKRFGSGAKYVDFTPAQKAELGAAMNEACTGKLKSCNFEACKFQKRRR